MKLNIENILFGNGINLNWKYFEFSTRNNLYWIKKENTWYDYSRWGNSERIKKIFTRIINILDICMPDFCKKKYNYKNFRSGTIDLEKKVITLKFCDKNISVFSNEDDDDNIDTIMFEYE